MNKCLVENCTKRIVVKGMCKQHYDDTYYKDKENKERKNRTSIEYARKHKEERKEYNTKYRKEYKKELKEKRNTPEAKERARNATLKHTYNIDNIKYNEMLKAQGEKCYSCDRHQSEFEEVFQVDHNHSCCPGSKSCGKCIRGLLCGSCNLILGLCKDNSEVLKKLINYLEKEKNNG